MFRVKTRLQVQTKVLTTPGKQNTESLQQQAASKKAKAVAYTSTLDGLYVLGIASRSAIPKPPSLTTNSTFPSIKIKDNQSGRSPGSVCRLGRWTSRNDCTGV